MSLLQIVFSIFLVLNSIGNIPLFISILGRYDLKRQRRIILRELLIALAILMVFALFGDEALSLLGISQPIIGVAGGTLLFIIALGMIFPKDHTPKAPVHEPMIVPLAIPVLAGPGAIASVMVYAEQLQNDWLTALAILLAWVPSALILLAASNIRRLLGTKGLSVCERLGGMLICLIAVKMFSCGVLTMLEGTIRACQS